MDPISRILLVDDETSITQNLTPFLTRSGYTVTVATDGETALQQIASQRPDLIVLDVEMPRVDGRQVLRQLRRNNDPTPVILLTKFGEADERALALREGADDYMNKPFSPGELVARIEAILRRARLSNEAQTPAKQLISGELQVELNSHRVYLAKREIFLPPKAFTLLEYLMTHPNQVFSRDQLLDAVWGWDAAVVPQTVPRHISTLRRELGDDADEPRYIETVHGGYMFIGKVEKRA